MSPRLTIIGLHFAPEPTGNAPYTTSLAEGMSALGWDVTVVTGYPHYPQWRVYEGYSGNHRNETVGAAQVLRLRHFVPSTPRLVSRVLMELHFGLRASLADWRSPDVVLFVSPALFATALASVAAKFRYRGTRTAVWVQDIYARGLQESHVAGSGFVAPVRVVEHRVLAAADKVVVIHERFRRHMCERVGLPEQRVEVIRNWSHIRLPSTVDVAAVRRRFGWDDVVVVLHAGNMGVKQYLENVVDAAQLADERGSRVLFVLLGDGNQRAHLKELAAGIDRLEFVDPLPDEEYTAALAAADVLLVNEKPGVRDMAVPSKLTSYFTTGRPVLAAVEPESATAGEVELSEAGVVVRSGNPEALLMAAESLGSDSETASRLGSCGQRFATEHLSPESAFTRWDKTLRALMVA